MKKFVEKTDIVNLDQLRQELLSESSKSPSLTVMSGDLIGKVIQLETFAEVYAGRDPENDIPVDETGLSRRHCVFYRQGNRAFVRDFDSTNGVFVNGSRVKEQSLVDGDRIFLADVYAAKFSFMDESDLVVNRILFEKATRDPLTGIINRTYFMENLGKEFSFHRRAKLPLSVIFFDLDDFKKVNDTYGHLCGDMVLRSVTEVIKDQIREEDCFARYGGEEFVIFLKNTTADAARLLAEKFRRVLEETKVPCADAEVGITGSFGVVTFFSDNFQSAHQMLIIADTLMYQAKQAGKNRVFVSAK